jgi:hypothetical protein
VVIDEARRLVVHARRLPIICAAAGFSQSGNSADNEPSGRAIEAATATANPAQADPLTRRQTFLNRK